MADLKISQLTDGGASQATDEYVVARSGSNFRIDGASVAAAATSVGTLSSLTVSGNTSLASSSGGVGIGVAAGSSKLNVAGTFTKNTGDENTWGIRVTDDTAMTTGVGGGLVFVGNYTSGGGKASFASIAGAKANSTTANGLGELRFYTTDVSSVLQQRAVIDSSGNVGIGTASPAQRLDVAGNSVFGTHDGENFLNIERYASGLPYAILRAGSTDQNVGVGFAFQYRDSNGTAQDGMFLNSSGNLGLGVTPSAWGSSFYKAIEGGDSNNQGAVAFRTDTNGVELFANCFFNGTNNTYKYNGAAGLYQNTAGQHIWYTAPSGTAGNAISFTQAMTLDASGNLGVGETSPGQRLVVRNTSAAPYVSIIAGDSSVMGILMGKASNTVDGQILYSNSTQAMQFVTASSERARITSGGDFLVGTASTGAGRLYVRGPGTTTGYSFEAANSAGTTRFATRDDGLIQFLSNTGGTESGRFTTGGYFKASSNGTYISDTGNYHELRGTNNSATLVVTNTSTSYTDDVIYGNVTTAAGTGFKLMRLDANSVEQFRVRGDGTIFAQNTTVQSLSDVRLKENISDAAEGLAVITALRPVRYDWKPGYGNDRTNQLGFIAQEVEAVFPEAVSEWVMDEPTGEVDEDGKPITEKVDYKTVGPGALIPVLVKAIQELEARIAALEA